MLNNNPVLRVPIRPLHISGVWTKNHFVHPSFLLFRKQLNMKLWISGVTMKLLNLHLIKYILFNSLFWIMAIVFQSRSSSSCWFVWKKKQISHEKKTKMIKSMHIVTWKREGISQVIIGFPSIIVNKLVMWN
jgi:hypothetical protein